MRKEMTIRETERKKRKRLMRKERILDKLEI